MTTRILELFGRFADPDGSLAWQQISEEQHCPFLDKKCVKVRKSQPWVSIGTCSVAHGTDRDPVIICPHRLLERRQIFTDCIHLLTLHEPGNELHIVSEISVPGGSVDYFLVSVRNGRVKDFAGVELQTLDTTGTVWPERQRFLRSVGMDVSREDVESTNPFGMNWKMTGKTTLVQLHHKVQTFEHLSKHLVLVLQDCLLDYLAREFSFGDVNKAALTGDCMQFHAYELVQSAGGHRLGLMSRQSTDADGVAKALGLQVSARMEYEALVRMLEAKLSSETLFNL